MSSLVRLFRQHSTIEALSATEYKLLGVVIASSACWTLLFQRQTFLFIYWNLFLAWIPIGIQLLFNAQLFVRLSAKLPSCKPILQVFGFVMWLLFLPNAPYILTDLVHPFNAVIAGRFEGVLLSTLCISSAAVCGLLWFLRSLDFFLQRFMQHPFGELMGRPLAFTLVLLSSIGVWIGRILRFNSWDILSKPATLLANSWTFIVTPFYAEVILVSTFFLWALWRGWERLRDLGFC